MATVEALSPRAARNLAFLKQLAQQKEPGEKGRTDYVALNREGDILESEGLQADAKGLDDNQCVWINLFISREGLKREIATGMGLTDPLLTEFESTISRFNELNTATSSATQAASAAA